MRSAVTIEPVAWSDEFASDPARQQQWAAFVRRSTIISAPERFTTVVLTVQSLLKPIVEACLSDEVMDSFWQAPGPWREGRA